MDRVDFNGWVGRGQDDSIIFDGPEIVIRKRRTKQRVKIKFEIVEQESPSMSMKWEDRNIFNVDHDEINMLKALAQALQDIGLLPGDANSAELKATKYHLEDMRSLVMKEKLNNIKT